MSSQYRQQINRWLKERTFKADQVLDVGGLEGPARKLTNLECNRYVILDYKQEEGVGIVHDLNEFKHADDLFEIEKNPRFDLIFCLNVFEYIWNPYNAIANLYTWLPEGGTVVVNFPFVYPVHNPEGIDYLRYTHEWVRKMFQDRFKFSEVDVTILQATIGADYLRLFYGAEGMHMRKNDDTWREIGCIVKATK